MLDRHSFVHCNHRLALHVRLQQKINKSILSESIGCMEFTIKSIFHFIFKFVNHMINILYVSKTYLKNVYNTYAYILSPER